jgi:serine/threonine-protein kinase RsbW
MQQIIHTLPEAVVSDAPTVSLKLESSPETLTLVRGMLGGVGELLALDPELLDDLKTAISEACNNVVMHAYDGGAGPLSVFLYVLPDRIEATIRDHGRGIPLSAPSDDRLQGVGIPIMRALAQQTAFRPVDDEGTEVWMQFAGRRDDEVLYRLPAEASPEEGWSERLSGDAVVSLSPVSFVGGVLGRLARAMAARARFSLDRFSDVYLVTDALAAHAAAAATTGRIAFGISTETRRLELTIGPFRPGASSALSSGQVSDVDSALRLLSDELEVRPEDGTESLRLLMLDGKPQAGT